MSPERTPRRGRKSPAPAITLQALAAIGEHVIAAWPYWFQGRHRRLDLLLDQHGYDRESQIAWERAADARYRIALALAYDRDSDQVVPLAVVGTAGFRDLDAGPVRLDASGGGPR